MLEALVVDLFPRFIAGQRVAGSLITDLLLDALEPALHARPDRDGLVQHTERDRQYVSNRHAERPVGFSVAPSVGCAGNSGNNALEESINGRDGTGLIQRRCPRRGAEGIEFAPLDWVSRFGKRRPLGTTGHIPPAELEASDYDPRRAPAAVAVLEGPRLRETQVDSAVLACVRRAKRE